MKHEVVFAPEASDDLRHLYVYIARASGDARAKHYIDRIISCCRDMDSFPERGNRRDDLYPGLRTTHYRGRVVIAFRVSAPTVTIVRILYGGRNIDALFNDDDSDG